MPSSEKSNSAAKQRLISRLNEIHNRESGSRDDDRLDAEDAVLYYIDDPVVTQLFRRIMGE